MLDIHYLRFVRALALAGTASLAACASNPQPDVQSSGQPCSLEGQPCTAYSSTPMPGGGPPCCYCSPLPVDSGSPDVVDADNDAMADAETDAAADMDASDAAADARVGVPGVYHSYCIGPLTPPENAA